MIARAEEAPTTLPISRSAVRALARRVLDWKAEEAGQPIAFSHAALLRLLAVGWVQAQLDTFCGARSPWFGGDDAAA